MESLLGWVKTAEEEHVFPILGEELNAEATKSGLTSFVAPFPSRYCGAAIESSIFNRVYFDDGTIKQYASIDDDTFCAFAGILIALSRTTSWYNREREAIVGRSSFRDSVEKGARMILI